MSSLNPQEKVALLHDLFDRSTSRMIVSYEALLRGTLSEAERKQLQEQTQSVAIEIGSHPHRPGKYQVTCLEPRLIPGELYIGDNKLDLYFIRGSSAFQPWMKVDFYRNRYVIPDERKEKPFLQRGFTPSSSCIGTPANYRGIL